MKSLYTISGNLRQLLETIQEQDGDITDEQIKQLEISQADLQDKSINYGLVIREVDGFCDVIDAEIKRLQGLKKKHESVVTSLKDRISQAMQEFGVEKVESPILRLSFRPSEETIIDDETLLTSEYLTPKQPIPNKAAIKRAIKEGKVIAGAHLEQKKNIQIK